MTRLLVIQPDDSDPAANLGDWLAAAGADLHVVRPFAEPLPALDGYQGVVCLGGEMGALDDVKHPWLKDVRQLLASATGNRVPVLGVCLGGQLLAVATGGRVVVGDAGPEVGPSLVAKRDLAWTDPLFADCPLMLDVMQFHVDSIDRLPPGADLMMSSGKYPNQAFRVNGCAYGLQFHIETTTDIVLKWAEMGPQAAATARPGALERENLDTVHAEIAEAWEPIAARFVRLASGELPLADRDRTKLPLL
ncbi:type 1 glutamine amidotransferase [Kibdelosporangium phytohabitans]|uniref:Glutamine amidotransferase n=1 Tax=Kibdelosporangium phytohabitans TaxID=860235 RepID=A0A0N9HXD7_9PSEU|nr:type 1 glutamine amidotransferase [Kibdelosporangium phytohabitans]ALG06877.1 glutamine amidotransferase [Kibdelosporangium phytohabitans]MBE1468128.1 GMP synthase-like glutamine amidotransferase [Kibdelosporangium phytohabitans]